MRPRALLALLALTALGAPAADAAACAGGHLGVRWTSFQEPIHDFTPAIFYHSVEPTTTGNVPIVITGSGDDCSVPPQPVNATYDVTTPAAVSRGASEGLDYVPIRAAQTGPLYGSHGPEPTQHGSSVRVLGDSLPETVVERAQATITRAENGRRDYPFDVPLYLVDDDGTPRASFEQEGPFERSETYGVISVPVFRAGPATGEATYPISVVGSSANPATPGDDYALPEDSVTFADGERVKLFLIQIFDDRKHEPPEELTVTLEDPGTLLPEDPKSATVRILDSVGASGLQSRLHHPRQRVTYRASDYRIREIHIFTTPGVGPPVTSADFALRRNMRGGKCAWWNGKKFRGGDCQNERWLRTATYEPDFFYYRLRELAPTKGRIKKYTAFSRARNGGNELEAFLEKGRNLNTFKVSRPKK